MDNKREIGFQSTLLVSRGVIIGAFVGAILAWWVGLSGVGVLLMALAVTGLVSRLWGLDSLRAMEASVRPERETLSVGQSVTVRYTIKNNKALPLVWVELLQDIPVRDCLVPDASFVRRTFSEEETAHTGRAEAYLRRLSFVMGYSTLEWDTEWTGTRRGVYRPGDLVLRSGDGFGLTQSSGEVSGLRGHSLIVWPRLVPVETWPFLRHVWTGATGRSGWAEDPTVMRGERAYQPGDPWKRIDWRTAARINELMVRQFDTVTPLSVLFILDAASLEDAEEGISILASVIHALSASGIDCGLALPETASREPLLLRAEDPAVTEADCMLALTEFEAESATERYDEKNIMTAAASTGQVWIVAQGTKSMGCARLAARISETGVRLLAARREDGGVSMSKVYTFDELRKKEAAT
ncbi:MAG: DUF58 domain-containing protein [Oscillospiraceae bacterium]